ncbi:MAG: TlpA family protein disulfide reductase [Bauldia sp.]
MSNATLTHLPDRANQVGRKYRYDHPRLYPDIINDMFVTSRDLGPGDSVPPFSLPILDGGFFRSSDLAAGKPVLVVFGSRTCPVTESATAGLKLLHEKYGVHVRFVMVNVREAHPGRTIVQPQTFDQKRRHAESLRSHHQLPFEVAVDDIDGTFHRALGGRPNSAYLLSPAGTILLRAQWANETEAIDAAISAVLDGEVPRRAAVTRTLHSMTRMIGYITPVLKAAGRGARLDTWSVVPPLGAMMVLADLFFFLPKDRRGLPAMLSMGAAVGAVAFTAVFLGFQ